MGNSVMRKGFIVVMTVLAAVTYGVILYGAIRGLFGPPPHRVFTRLRG